MARAFDLQMPHTMTYKFLQLQDITSEGCNKLHNYQLYKRKSADFTGTL